MAHKVMPPAFTSEQLEMIEGMIDAAIAELEARSSNRDIEDAVQPRRLQFVHRRYAGKLYHGFGKENG
jgi:hypothetical protein